MGFFFEGTTERVLHRVALWEIKLLRNEQPGSPVPALPHAEVALVVVELGHCFPQQKWDLSAQVRVVPALAAVHEHTLFLGVRVQVYKQENLLSAGRLEHNLFNCKDLGVV